MKDNSNIRMTGEVIDRIYDKKGNLIEERKGHNLVVNTFLLLIARLMSNEASFDGILYWAVGQGNASWDVTLPDPTIGDTQLVSEIGRVAIDPSDLSYLNDDMSVSSVPTHIIQIKHTFDENTLNGSWREFGIFGGDATMTMGSGLMINHRNHSVLVKTNEMVVERTMRFTLSLAS